MRSAWLVLLLATSVACGSSSDEAASPMADTGINDLQITDIVPGTGDEARSGRTVSVHYTGWLYDPKAADQKGKSFDSSRGGAPFDFDLGAGAVIPGWDKGVAGMKVGGQRRLTIPPDMGYGRGGAPPVIPPNATLLFEVELLNVR